MKLNGAKYPFMMFGNKSPDISVSISSSCIEQSDKEKLLRITFVKTWTSIATLQIHAKKNWPTTSCTCASGKILGPRRLQTVMNAFILSQFSYYPLIWMFHDRNVNNKKIKSMKDH